MVLSFTHGIHRAWYSIWVPRIRLNLIASGRHRHKDNGLRFLSQSSRRFNVSEDTFQDLVISRTVNAAKSTESKFIRCTIFDSHGDIVVHGKDINRQQFMRAHHLSPRDTRKLSRHRHGTASLGALNINVDIVPSLITRGESILLNFLNIKALIKSNTVVIFDSMSGRGGYNESHSHSEFLKEMSNRLKDRNDPKVPYEFRALECILVHATLNLTTEMNVHKTVLLNILRILEDSIERRQLRYLLIQSKKITQFHQKAILIRDLLGNILEEDDELNALYLTEKAKGKYRLNSDHAEAELMLESYYNTNDEIVQTSENLISQIKTTEEIINVVLDSNRNELMLLGLRFSVGLMSLGVALYVSALFGMNLENYIEETDEGFGVIVLISFLALFGFLLFTVNLLRKIQKVTMTGSARKELKNRFNST